MPFLPEEETPEHTSSLTGAKKDKEILEGHENWCKEEFRMEAEIFGTSSSFSSSCSSRSASDFGTNPFANFDGLYVSSAHNEAQSAPLNQDSVQGASGGKKRKQSHIGSLIKDYVEFKKMQTSKTLEALNEKKWRDEEISVQKCLDEVDSMVGLTDEKSYALDIFKTEINRIHENQKPKCSLYLAQAPD
ncbi:unnamed protein product [Miscanthus lutarioriparius]|uniref:Uncharacterized protein n=1 Tax=Miscanthus lutarioriparius TaxID=422564 RepID=A0A811M8C9_9POAL|nr:unnamed protein product [Miscanthus lutarioriparius]